MTRHVLSRLLTIVLCVAMVTGGFSVPAVAASMPDEDNPGFTYITGSGTEADPYVISSVDGWNELARFINTQYDGDGDRNYTYFTGKYFKLTQDISINTSSSAGDLRIGECFAKDTDIRKFGGTFDGDGHTLTVTIKSNDFQEGNNDLYRKYCAPFRYIEGATIRNLTVTGTITSEANFAAGLVGAAFNMSGNSGPSRIENCNINLTLNGSGQYKAGILAIPDRLKEATGKSDEAYKAQVYITDCVFGGTMSGKGQDAGGIVSWNKGDVYLERCVFAGTVSFSNPNALGNADTFIVAATGNGSNNSTKDFTEVYYTNSFGTVDPGAYAASSTEPASGDYEEFTVAGQTFYRQLHNITISNASNGSVGTDRANGKAGEGAVVSLSSNPCVGYELDSFTVKDEDNGNITVTDGRFKMPAKDVTVSAAFQQLTAPAFRQGFLTLGADIGVSLGIDLTPLTTEERNASYVTFTVSPSADETTVNFSDATQTDGLYYFPCHVNAIQMADTITATYHYTQGGTAATVVKECSVTQLIEAYLNSDTDATTKDLVRALKDLGYYSQVYLSALRHWTIGTDHAAVTDPYVSSFDIAAIRSAISDRQVSKSLVSQDIQKATISLTLDSKTDINLYVTPQSGYTGSITATVGGTAADVTAMGDGTYRITISGIGPKQLGNMYSVAITTTNGTSTVSVSAMSYVYGCLGTAGNRANCVASIYNYYQAADAWVTAHSSQSE